ncbi:hypothetical protein [Phnomibacter ginsenosidimutans]|uniref:Uncharacterized protein n=1 Tax=Phnomibacter ginsenosidimutans TaxID=2676868 RepID=A0A6I6GGC5_9BACT|nr:hypothetical protein [Phnomibacter ginsenosidimutans]QGW26708.1 hypothetical protein GLV81_00040 [Phnomibacter ginsenosidimutans]
MLRKIINWFSKSEDDRELQIQLPQGEDSKFTLSIDNLKIGWLYCEGSYWYFKYSEEFKQHSNEYNHIVGFPDLNKVYKSETLWPFFSNSYPWFKAASRTGNN